MPLYAYKGIGANGKSVAGIRNADSPKGLRQLMRKDACELGLGLAGLDGTAGDEYERWDVSLVSDWLLPSIELSSTHLETRVTAGADFVSEQGESDSALDFGGGPVRLPFFDERQTVGLFGELEERIGRHVVLTVDLRYDTTPDEDRRINGFEVCHVVAHAIVAEQCDRATAPRCRIVHCRIPPIDRPHFESDSIDRRHNIRTAWRKDIGRRVARVGCPPPRSGNILQRDLIWSCGRNRGRSRSRSRDHR